MNPEQILIEMETAQAQPTDIAAALDPREVTSYEAQVTSSAVVKVVRGLRQANEEEDPEAGK